MFCFSFGISTYCEYLLSRFQKEGEILASFQLVPLNDKGVPEVEINRRPNLRPETTDCILEVVAMGLRDLAPYQMIPPQRPYIVVSADVYASFEVAAVPTPLC
jgi:hypothetical protein